MKNSLSSICQTKEIVLLLLLFFH